MERIDKQLHDTRENIRLDPNDYEHLREEFIELRELEKMKVFLQEENQKSRDQIEILTRELEGIDIFVSSAHARIAAYDAKRRQFHDTFDKLKAAKEALAVEVSRLRQQIKAAREDEQSTNVLIKNLKQELDEISTEKAIIAKRLESVRSGIDRISQDRDTQLPYLERYGELCRRIRAVLRDTQNSMEVTLRLRRKDGTCNTGEDP